MKDDLTQVENKFPPHEKCAGHTLNLVVVDKCLYRHLSQEALIGKVSHLVE